MLTGQQSLCFGPTRPASSCSTTATAVMHCSAKQSCDVRALNTEQCSAARQPRSTSSRPQSGSMPEQTGQPWIMLHDALHHCSPPEIIAQTAVALPLSRCITAIMLCQAKNARLRAARKLGQRAGAGRLRRQASGVGSGPAPDGGLPSSSSWPRWPLSWARRHHYSPRHLPVLHLYAVLMPKCTAVWQHMHQRVLHVLVTQSVQGCCMQHIPVSKERCMEQSQAQQE